MKLDATDLRYVTSEEFRVLTAVRTLLLYPTYHFPSIQVEMGSKNHEVVPSALIAPVSGLRNGGVNKILGILAKRNLVAKVQNSKCMYVCTIEALKLTFG
jgi:RIO kinase 2